MYRQVGDLELDEAGIARKGLIIRHLVLPGDISSTARVLEFIAELSTSVGVSLMSQYFPAHRAISMPELQRRVTQKEYEEALHLLDSYGLTLGWIQPPG
jgi:putative pyruvate formate lyase activating enzyme